MRSSIVCGAVTGLLMLTCQLCSAADNWGLSPGAVELKSAGPLAFGPNGILFVGDPTAATVYAIATGDAAGDRAKVNLNIPAISTKLAETLGATPQQVQVNDLAVNPASGNVYLSVSAGEPKQAALVRIDASGKLSKVELKDVKHSKAPLANAPESAQGGRGNPRDESITDLAFVDGTLIVSGRTGGRVSSTMHELPFPFASNSSWTNVEIYHGAHGRVEDNATVRTFVPFKVNGKPVLLAGFTCTPLVMFPLESLEPEKKVRGTTVAELGNRNRPMDMIVYNKDGKDYVLMTNSARGVMKISTDNIQGNQGINEPVRDGGTAGQSFETVQQLQNVQQMDRLNDGNIVILAKAGDALDLQTVALP